MSTACEELHTIFRKIPRHHFPFAEDLIPLNGIYVLFEKGEFAHGGDRIVRVGTHTGNNQLRSRLRQHFINENKDRSIFRKNIGRAILNKRKDPLVASWELDLTTKAAKDKFLANIDMKKQQETEKEVTKHIQGNFSFIVFEVKDTKKRLELESKIISTISACEECKPSENWLGCFSPKEKIKKSGLWLVNELYKEPLTEIELQAIKTLIPSM